MMGGNISFKSVYGQGSIFTVTVPVIPGCKERMEEKIAISESRTIHAPDAKVLVVDDMEFNLKVACALLKMLGIQARTADSGLTAIELIERNDYDIVFMDHMMPEADGIETTAQIRAMGGKYETLPIIALTANAVQGVREMFLANGFDDFLSKPVNIGELVRILENWLPAEKIREKAEVMN
jgi:CheY-like chemotaxis protein